MLKANQENIEIHANDNIRYYEFDTYRCCTKIFDRCDMCEVELGHHYIIQYDIRKECDVYMYQGTNNYQYIKKYGLCICYNCASTIMNEFKHGGQIIYNNKSDEQPKKNKTTSDVKLRMSKKRRILERDRYRCRYCGGWENIGIDHIHPVSRGGSNDDENLVACCRSCNSRKSNKLLSEIENMELMECQYE